MKIKMRLNGVTVTHDIPVRWKEVTFSQLLQIHEAQNDLSKRLSIFTGIDPETLKKVSIQNLDTIMNCLSFIDNVELDMSIIPKELMGYKMPENLSFETIAQFEDLKLEAAKLKDDIKPYATFCAIYATTPYDWAEAEKKIDLFMSAPCEEVMAIGNFTLAKLIESKEPSLKKALSPPSLLKKKKRAIRAWLVRLVFTVRYYFWKRKLRIRGTNS